MVLCTLVTSTLPYEIGAVYGYFTWDGLNSPDQILTYSFPAVGGNSMWGAKVASSPSVQPQA